MTLELLNQRRSVLSRQLGAPGPDRDQLRALLTAAIRVPDHGKLTPFRLIVVEGDARAALGAKLADMHLRHEPDASPSAIEKDRQRFGFAPTIVIVVARVEDDHPKVPAQEQILSAGCVAYNLLIGAQAQGFGAQWLTGWAAYDREAAALFGLAENERVIAFVHIGSARDEAPERTRPSLDDVLTTWSPDA